MTSPHRSTFAVIALTVAGLVLTACAEPKTPSAASTPVAPPPATTRASSPAPATSTAPAAPASSRLAAAAKGPKITVYKQPAGKSLTVLANPISSGAPLTFLVSKQQGDWVQVQLAQRPNGSTGWVRSDDVTLQSLTYGLRVSTKTNTLTLSRNGNVTRTFPVATGTGGTPTPLGFFYLTELLAPRNTGYGPYAFGVSAFSTVLNTFGGGPGQIGLHGTDDAGSIGNAASHGCIRMRNKDITTLARLLPLGTPLTITDAA